MIGFFPKAFDDECFYSLCARYAEIVNYPCKEKVLTELFNKRSKSVAVDLPSSLRTFIKTLGIQTKFSEKTIIENHSLLPYYAPFLPSDRVEKLISNMKYSTGEAIHKISGITAASINKPNKLRYCPSCALDETNDSGIVYWHRLHQLPGVFVCPRHLCFLEDSLADLSKDSYRANFFSPKDYINFTIPQQTIDLHNKNHKILLFVSQDSEWLLKTKVSCLGYEKLKKKYVDLLTEKKLMLSSTHLSLNIIKKKFRQLYDSDLLDLIQCNFDDKKEYQWISRIVPHLGFQRVHHPLRHILLIRLLSHTVETFFSRSSPGKIVQSEENHPIFTERRYPCLNPVCDIYRKLLIESYEIKHYRKRKDQTLFVKCNCGFAYFRNGKQNKKDDIYRKDVVTNYGELWEKELIKLWRDKNLSMNKISHLLGVSHNTIKNRALAQNLKFPRKSPDGKIVKSNLKTQKKLQKNYLLKQNKEKLLKEKTEKYRQEWLKLRNEYPLLIRSKLANLSPKVAGWLRKNDSVWFQKNLPKAWHRVESARQIDWKLRDKECVNKIKKIAESIRNRDGKPIWVRPSSIANELEHREWVSNKKYLNKMPFTKKTINELTESRIDYNIRRINWAVDSIKEDGTSYAFSSIGLRAVVDWNLWQLPEIKKAIEDGIIEIKKHRKLF